MALRMKKTGITNKRVSRFKYTLFLLLIALLSAVTYVLSQFALQRILQSPPTLSSYISALVSAAVVGIGLVYLNRYLITHGIRFPVLRRTFNHVVYIIPGDGQPINEELIRRYEDALRFSDKNSENYVAELAMLGFMYLQNAIAYGNKDLYLRARDYLDKARDAMKTVRVSDKVRILVERLEKEVESNKAKFENDNMN